MILQPMQTVHFDPANKKHRQAVQAFMKRNAWGDSPIRFAHDPAYGSIADQVRDKMLKWYMTREFSAKNKKVSAEKMVMAKSRPGMKKLEVVG